MKNEYVKEYGSLEISHWWFAVRKKIILQSIAKYLSKGKALSVLNIGAAAGASSQWLSVFGKVVSVENEPVFVGYLQNENIEVVNASAIQLPFSDNSFDLVCAFDVVEHIEDDATALAEMQRVCKPGGKICITVPAYQLLWSLHDVVNNHQRRYTFASLKKQLAPGSFVQYSTYFNTLLFLPVWLARKMNNLFGKKNEAVSDFDNFKQGNFSSAVCRFIFNLETSLLKIMRFPFGVSLLVILEKKASTKDGN